MKHILALVVVLLGSTLVDAQTIRPRGSAPKVEPVAVTTPMEQTPAPAERRARDAQIEELRRELSMIVSENPAHAGQIKKLQTALDEATAQAEESPSRWIAVMGVFFALPLGFVLGWFIGRRRITPTEATKHVKKGASATALLFCLGASTVAAQPATTKAPAACSIRAIVNGAVVVKEQDGAAISIAVRNCGDVKEIKAMVDATNASTEIEFTGVALKGNVVTAKVTATSAALTGPTSFKLVLADSEIASPDAIYLLVLDTATAQVRKDLTADTAKIVAATTAVTKEVTALKATVATKADKAEVASKATKAEVDAVVAAAIAPLQAKLAAIEAANNANTNDIGVLGDATSKLAEGQKALGETIVKKGGFLGFGGKSALNQGVAASAELIRQAVTPTKK